MTQPAPGSADRNDHANDTDRTDDVVRDLRRALDREPGSAPGRHARTRDAMRPRRRWRLAVIAVAVAALVAAVVVRGRDPVAAPTVAPPRATGWTDVVSDLDVARTAAWSRTDVGALQIVDVPGSTADRADRSAVVALRAAGVRPVGLRFEVASVGAVRVSAGRAVLRVVDRRSAYALVDRRGAVVRRVDARGPRAWTVEVRWSAPGWRFVSARPLGP